MNLSFKLSFYIIRQFLSSFAIVFGVFTALIILIDALELLRRSHNREVPFFIILQMVLLKFPIMGQKIIPFSMLIGAVLSYTKLNKNQELAVIRSAGVSVWQFLLPSVITALSIGVLMITMLNPLSCIMIAKYEQMEAKHLHGKSSILAIESSGLWLRQKESLTETGYEKAETILHARSVGGENEIELYDVIIFVYRENGDFSRRIDAKEAKLLSSFWHLEDVIITLPDGSARRHDEYFLETNLTTKDIQDSFASPETISFWALPSFIATLKKSGFSALSHKLHWHAILSTPLLYASMVFIAALFSLKHSRQGRTGLLITGSIITGFLIYFLTSLVSSLGLSGGIPIAIAAWVPVGISMLIGVGLLLHFEDG